MGRNVDREGPIQKACYKFLCTQYPRALIFSVPNELASKVGGGDYTPAGKIKRQRMIRNVQARAKELGMLPGMSDLCMLLDGIFYAFEVKAEGNKQQDNQNDVQAVTEANSGVYAVVRSIDDIKEVMKAHPAVIEHRGTIS
ncbi:MAG: hypothetical protein Unbinned7865contig1001_31 [Prokaryotic dsDNA virus sp.]|nr:MAG: hypothetical protein Unbinned7865contig1001_31 [Prokaryotic dsDNA virus sp.]|tara:strand:- start:4792 stop:5214 length:423 start_codon:yes stop_codon:yes gene_type:complete